MRDQQIDRVQHLLRRFLQAPRDLRGGGRLFEFGKDGPDFIGEEGARVRPDQSVVFFEEWERPEDRLRGTRQILRKLVELAQPAKAA